MEECRIAARLLVLAPAPRSLAARPQLVAHVAAPLGPQIWPPSGRIKLVLGRALSLAGSGPTLVDFVPAWSDTGQSRAQNSPTEFGPHSSTLFESGSKLGPNLFQLWPDIDQIGRRRPAISAKFEMPST